MSEVERDAPCRTCGSPVRYGKQKMEQTLTDVANRYEEVRICTNPKCQTKGRDKGLSDVV